MDPAPRLEPFTAAHLAAFAPLTEDPDVLRFTRFPDPPQAGFPEAWLARYEQGRRDGTKEAFAVLDPADGTLLGVALAVEVDRARGWAELGYLVAPQARGRGVAVAALRALTAWAFSPRQRLSRAELVIDVDNVASRRVAERAGYALARIEADVELRPGRISDTAIYALTSAESGAPQASRSSGGGTL
jgi:RimJ/RimL family protein N-acetyltransferase